MNLKNSFWFMYYPSDFWFVYDNTHKDACIMIDIYEFSVSVLVEIL